MRARRTLACAVALWMAASAPASAAGDPAVDVTLGPARVATRLGDDVRLQSTITNAGRAPLRGLVAHLDVVSVDGKAYVDPEDWSSERTQYLPPLAPGRSLPVDWTVTAVNGGRFAIYVVVLGSGRPVVGPGVGLRVAQRRTLDPEGVLPLAVGVPALLAAGMLGVRLRRRR